MEPRSTYRTEEHRTGKPVADLIRELRDETTILFKQELLLAKKEMSEKASRVGKNVGMIAAGGLVAYAGALLLLYAISNLAVSGLVAMGLSLQVAAWLGPAIVGLIVALIGYAMYKSASEALSKESLAPEKTIETIQEDKEWMQHKIKRE
jgi:hypothetical protein